MPSRRALLEISPSRLELTVASGGEAGPSRAERVAVTDYNEGWPRALETTAAALGSLVRAADAGDAETTIIYHAPTSAVLSTPVPASAGVPRALQAAKLALAEAANRALSDHPHDLERLWRDEEATGAAAGTVAQQAHILSFADADETAEAVVRAAKAAGLRPIGLIPAEGISVTAAIETALTRSKDFPEAVVVLSCGEHFSTLAAAIMGRLKFVRRVGIGTEMLVDALAREIRPTRPDAAPVTLDHAQAAAVLFKRGIPARGLEFDPESGLDADAVLPLVQPVLQRCVVELRQSLRFGLDETERSGAKLVVIGMGLRIGRLPQVIAEQTHLSLTDAGAAPAAPAEPTSTASGLIHQWSSGRQFDIRIIPSSLKREQTARRVRRGMMFGYAAAAAFVLYAAIDARMDLSTQRTRIEAAKERLEGANQMTELNSSLVAAQSGLANAKGRMISRLSIAAPWDALMVVFSQCTPPSVKISECDMFLEKGKPTCRISGRTPMLADGDANAVMRSFLDALGTVPLVKSTRLGATQRAESDSGPVQSFEMTITLVDLPALSSDSRPELATVPILQEDPQ